MRCGVEGAQEQMTPGCLSCDWLLLPSLAVCTTAAVVAAALLVAAAVAVVLAVFIVVIVQGWTADSFRKKQQQ
jgi:hypothetical protein